MGSVRKPLPVKLFIGMLSSDAALLDACALRLMERFGPVDRRSEPVPWDVTDYYDGEMGRGLQRQFLFFERLIDPLLLVDAKLATNGIEAETAAPEGNRRINLDPGYVTEAKVVLASTKDFSHRLYLSQGIYGEVTLVYRKADDSFLSLEHTYPDFRTAGAVRLFNEARERLRCGLKK